MEKRYVIGAIVVAVIAAVGGVFTERARNECPKTDYAPFQAGAYNAAKKENEYLDIVSGVSRCRYSFCTDRSDSISTNIQLNVYRAKDDDKANNVPVLAGACVSVEGAMVSATTSTSDPKVAPAKGKFRRE